MHGDPTPTARPFVRRVRLKNYKSIAGCDVALGQLVALVGRNGSGKSNFLDALHFVADGLGTTLDHALRERGGFAAVRRQGAEQAEGFAISLEFQLPPALEGTYGFEIVSRGGSVQVQQEQLDCRWSGGRAFYRVEEGELQSSSSPTTPRVASDRLYLVTLSGLAEYRPIYDALVSMGFYNLNPELMKLPQNPDAGELLHREGDNVSSVIGRLAEDAPADMERLCRYLEAIVPGIVGVERVSMGPRETIEFRVRVEGAEHPWRFYAMNMSDGTLRSLGILAAVAQLARQGMRVRFVGIEEPETALHPAAAGAMVSALREASSRTQIVVTTHSPELLDVLDLSHDDVIVVQSRGGTTELAGIDNASREAVKQHLYSPGELLRMDQLQADPQDVERQQQVEIFSEQGAGVGARA